MTDRDILLDWIVEAQPPLWPSIPLSEMLEGERRAAATKIDELEREVNAWRERFPVAGFDGSSIVLSG